MNSMGKRLLVWLLLALVALPAVTYAQGAPTFKKEEIEQLVAPIALYPDPLLAQILMASTYPLEVVEAARWVKSNPNVKDKALEDAMAQQKWDPSVKSLTAFPQVLTMMNDKLDMTQKLGDAFLAQQKDVLDAVQSLRSKAQAAGNLASSKEQTVSTAQEAGTTVIKIEPAQPQTVYVPTYNPTAVYGAWPYPAYPPYSYYPPGYVAGTALLSFSAGLIVGNALWGDCDWGHGDVNINASRYNSFNRTNVSNARWNHNAEHRRGVQYRDPGSQQRFGKGQQRAGTDSREAFRGRADQGRQDIARGGADQFKGATPGSRDRGAGGATERRAGGGAEGRAGAGAAGRTGAGAAGRTGAGAQGRAGGGGGGGLQRTSGGAGAFQGMGSGGQTRDFSQRGAASRSSAASHAGGGGARGGGGGGGGRGGGGGGRGGGGRGR